MSDVSGATSTDGPVQLVWHRDDLRVHDHRALAAAVEAGPTLGLVVFDPTLLDAASERRRAWFYANAVALRDRYRARGGTLLFRRGSPWDVVPQVAAEVSAATVHAIASYTPYGRQRDQRTAEALALRLRLHTGNYLYEPGTVVKDDGTPYRVYTPFARRAGREALSPPLPAPLAIAGSKHAVLGEAPVAESDVALPPAGEEAALLTLRQFLETRIATYHLDRDSLDGAGGSGLSVYFTLGVLSPRLAATAASAIGGPGPERWIQELLWRDFMAELLLRYPHMLTAPFDRRWQALPWQDRPDHLEAWRNGRTGVPVVDASMRQLRATGWISNRARMLTAQFLVKHLLLPWRWGEEVFREWLLDADLSNNVGGWQWAGGLGVDAAPYFRVFNLETQGERHDPDGAWLRRWLPESSGSPRALEPIVDLADARRHYLAVAAVVSKAAQDVPAPTLLTPPQVVEP